MRRGGRDSPFEEGCDPVDRRSYHRGEINDRPLDAVRGVFGGRLDVVPQADVGGLDFLGLRGEGDADPAESERGASDEGRRPGGERAEQAGGDQRGVPDQPLLDALGQGVADDAALLVGVLRRPADLRGDLVGQAAQRRLNGVELRAERRGVQFQGDREFTDGQCDDSAPLGSCVNRTNAADLLV